MTTTTTINTMLDQLNDDNDRDDDHHPQADNYSELAEENKTSVVQFADDVDSNRKSLHQESETTKTTNENATESNKAGEVDETTEDEPPKEFQRRRLAKKTTMSAPARKALEAQQLSSTIPERLSQQPFAIRWRWFRS